MSRIPPNTPPDPGKGDSGPRLSVPLSDLESFETETQGSSTTKTVHIESEACSASEDVDMEVGDDGEIAPPLSQRHGKVDGILTVAEKTAAALLDSGSSEASASPHSSSSAFTPLKPSKKNKRPAESLEEKNPSCAPNKKASLTPPGPSHTQVPDSIPSTSGSHITSNPPPLNLSVKDSRALLANNRYRQTHKGPFVVYVEPEKEDSQIPINIMAIEKYLYTTHNRGIKNVKELGAFKLSIEFQTASAANSLVESSPLKTKKLFAYIPSFCIARFGILKDIHIDFPEEDIVTFAESESKILSIKRLNRKIKTSEGNFTFAPSKSILVKFDGQDLPNHIYLFRVKREIIPYIPRTLLCYNCFRFGHTNRNCKSKQKCIHCGNLKHAESSACPKSGESPICANCGGNHLPTYPECPAYITQKNINSYAALYNVSLQDARVSITNCTPAPANNLRNFPLLPSSSPSPPSPPTTPHTPPSPISTLSPPPPHTPPQQHRPTHNFAQAAKTPPLKDSEIAYHYRTPDPPNPYHNPCPHARKAPLPPRANLSPPKALYYFPNGQYTMSKETGVFFQNKPQYPPNDHSYGNIPPSPYINSAPPLQEQTQSFLSVLVAFLLRIADKIAPFFSLMGLSHEFDSFVAFVKNLSPPNDNSPPSSDEFF